MARHAWWLLAMVLTAACGGERSPLRVGTDGPPMAPGGHGGAGGSVAGHGGASGGGASAGTGSTRNPLTVRVLDPEAMEIEIVTLQCAGACAEVEAVARGGNPPYAFRWSDGSTSAVRELCPTASTRYEVTATDTAIDSEEFRYDAAMTTVEVTAEVLDCSPDGGTAPDGSTDPLPPEGCVDLAIYDELGIPPYQRCAPSPELIDPNTGAALGDCVAGLAGDDTMRVESHARLAAYDGAPAELESLSLRLCSPLAAGQLVNTLLSLSGFLSSRDALGFHAVDTSFDVELWGGSSPCDKDELLWSYENGVFGDYAGMCAQLTPARDHTFLHVVFRMRTAPGLVRDACLAPRFGSAPDICF